MMKLHQAGKVQGSDNTSTASKSKNNDNKRNIISDAHSSNTEDGSQAFEANDNIPQPSRRKRRPKRMWAKVRRIFTSKGKTKKRYEEQLIDLTDSDVDELQLDDKEGDIIEELLQPERTSLEKFRASIVKIEQTLFVCGVPRVRKHTLQFSPYCLEATTEWWANLKDVRIKENKNKIQSLPAELREALEAAKEVRRSEWERERALYLKKIRGYEVSRRYQKALRELRKLKMFPLLMRFQAFAKGFLLRRQFMKDIATATVLKRIRLKIRYSLMEVYKDMHFTEEENIICESKCCHCSDETIKPFQIPDTKIILWDHQPYGLSQIVHLSQYRKPLIRIKNKIIGSGSGMVAKMKQGMVHLVVSGILSYNNDSVDGGLRIFLNQFEEKGAEDQFTAPIIFANNISIPSTKEEEYHNDLKFISEHCHCSSLIDPNKFVKVRLKCLTKGLSCQIMVEMISIATKFVVTPVPPIPTVITALSNRLSALSSRKEMQTGFVVMDKFRKLVLFLENDPKVYEFPVVGLWLSGVPSVTHPFVWISFLRYISCSQYSNRLCLPPQPFLLVLYSSNCELPEYYDCITSDGSLNLSYDLYNGCAVASVSRFPTLDVTITDIELSKVADKTRWKYFVNAENQLLSGRQQSQNIVPNLIVSNTDDMPQISPVPQPIKMIESRPLVPDLSLAASKNSIHLDPCRVEDKNILHCDNYKNQSVQDYVRQTMCPTACVHNEFLQSDNKDSFMPDSICNADCLEQQLNAAVSHTNDARIIDNAKSNCKLNFHTELSSNCHVHSDDRLSKDKQIAYKENYLPLIKSSTSKPAVQENIFRRNNSKTSVAQPTRIPKFRSKQTEKFLLPTIDKLTSGAKNECKKPDIEKTVLLASASTMTSIVWPPSTNLESQAKKTYVDEVLQTDELNFDRKKICASKPVVECAATQTSICEKKPENKEFHCKGCCQCCFNKCNVRRNFLRPSLPSCCHYDDDDEIQCETSGINSSAMEDPFSDVFNSECNSEDDILFLGESASTTKSSAKQNQHKIAISDTRHKEQKNKYEVSNHTTDSYSEEEDFKLYNIIQGHISEIPVERNASTAKEKQSLPSAVFHSTSETTKKLNSYALKYIEPEVLSEFTKSYRLDSGNDWKVNDMYRNQYIYESKKSAPEDQVFKPSSRNVLASQFSVATNKHLEKYVFS